MTVDVRNPQGRALTPAERSKVISESLRQMARVSRFANRRKGGRGSYGGTRKSDPAVPILFVVLFVLPVLAGAAYYGLIASDRYVTEARFANTLTLLRQITILGMGHAWSGGKQGMAYMEPRGPSASEAIVSYFLVEPSSVPPFRR